MKLRAALGIGCALTLLPAAPALADSIIFIKDSNVWVAQPDGSGARAITADGTQQSPYWSPSQADDGTIAAAYEQGIRLLHRDGTKLAELDPPARTDSVSHGVDGAVADVAISPDGQTIAYAYSSYSCPVAADCTGRRTLGYMATDGYKAPETYSGGIWRGEPSWVSNSRTLVFGGYGGQVNIHDLGPGTTEVHWFDDHDVVGQENATDLGDAELSRQGNKLALIRGYGDTSTLYWYEVTGNALSGPPPAAPRPVCAAGPLKGMHGPTWAPSGDGLAWGEPDGVWAVPSTTLDDSKCTEAKPRLVIPGGSEPDWGPADIGAPKPPPIKDGPDPLPPTPGPGPVQPASLAITTAKAPRLGKVMKGMRVSLHVPGAGTLKATGRIGSKVVLKGSGTAAAAGDLSLRLKATKAARRFARKRSAKLTISVAFTPSGGAAQTVRKSLALKR